MNSRTFQEQRFLARRVSRQRQVVRFEQGVSVDVSLPLFACCRSLCNWRYWSFTILLSALGRDYIVDPDRLLTTIRQILYSSAPIIRAAARIRNQNQSTKSNHVGVIPAPDDCADSIIDVHDVISAPAYTPPAARTGEKMRYRAKTKTGIAPRRIIPPKIQRCNSIDVARPSPC